MEWLLILGFIIFVFYSESVSSNRSRNRKPNTKSNKNDVSNNVDTNVNILKIRRDFEKNLNSNLTYSSNSNAKQNDHEYVSSTMLAKEMGIKGPILIEHFIRCGLLSRDRENKLILTAVGKKLGGAYRHKSERVFWVVWPLDIKESHYFKSIASRSTNLETYSSAISPKLINKIQHYGSYYPFHRGRNPNFDRFSSRVLDFKRGENSAIQYFFKLLTSNADFDRTNVVVYVPSHDKSKFDSPVKKLAKMLASHYDWVDGTDCLVRTKTIDKLALGGPRDQQVHFDSLIVKHSDLILDKNILVLDDVTTTGNSLYASMDLLKRNGAKSTWSYALAKTQR